jgi:hypothetical protein
MSASAEEEDRSMARRKKHSPEEIVAKVTPREAREIGRLIETHLKALELHEIETREGEPEGTCRPIIANAYQASRGLVTCAIFNNENVC